MLGLVNNLRFRARLVARAAAFTAVGVVFAVTGLAFLTGALWVLLESYEGALFAWTVIGIVYLIFGLIFLVIAGRGNRNSPVVPVTQAPTQSVEPFLQMAEAFAVGMQAGRRARRPRN